MISSNGLIIIEMVSSETVDRGTVLFILKVSISGVELTGNTTTIKSNENSVTIAPASGIDIAIGKKD